MKPLLKKRSKNGPVIVIAVQDPFRELIADQVLSAAAEITLQKCNLQDSPALSVRVTNDQEIQDLNQRYRGIDQVTDVLSFATDFFDPDLDSRYLGDVIISYPQAENQAAKRDHSSSDELQLLVVHGVLHLLGYDHAAKSEKEIMWSLQDQILAELGLTIQVEDV